MTEQDAPAGWWGRLRAWWSGWRAWYDTLVQEYGPAFVVTYLTLFFATWLGFWVAVRSGWSGDGAADMGTVGLAWVLTKATQPLRIGAAALLMPVVVKVRRRFSP